MATHASAAASEPTQYTYEQVAVAAGNFSNRYLLGEGGYGQVYQGKLNNKICAIKKLRHAPYPLNKGRLEREIKVISGTSHPNLVKLMGYCLELEQHNALLVLEYCPNKSLKFNLHERKILDWPKRMNIAIGSAKGLEYLHQYSSSRKIIHHDIKPDNILLDDNFQPKVADFGLASFLPHTASHLSTTTEGTKDYMDPLYPRKISDKTDVYSFGVVLLELITGRKSSHGGIHIICWALLPIRQALMMKTYTKLVDSNLHNVYDRKQMRRMILCAASCVYKSLNFRPTVKQIVEALENGTSLRDIWDVKDHKLLLDNPNVKRLETMMSKLPNNGIEKTMETKHFSNSIGEIASAESTQFLRPRILTYQQLRKATEGFSNANLLCQDVFGVIYKGRLDSKVEVSIKKLKYLPDEQHKEELEKKIKDMSNMMTHSNLINHIGYCIENLNRFFISEFIAGNTLKSHLYGKKILEWPKRMKIAVDSGKGLIHLHENCKIIHGNLNINNIIVDSNFEPKITNFGLIMFYPSRGLMYSLDYRKFLEKSDIYDFGVLLLELISGREMKEKGSKFINDRAKTLIEQAMNGTVGVLSDPKLNGYDELEIKRIIYCAASCIYKGSPMKKIVRALEGQIPLENVWGQKENELLRKMGSAK